MPSAACSAISLEVDTLGFGKLGLRLVRLLDDLPQGHTLRPPPLSRRSSIRRRKHPWCGRQLGVGSSSLAQTFETSGCCICRCVLMRAISSWLMSLINRSAKAFTRSVGWTCSCNCKSIFDVFHCGMHPSMTQGRCLFTLSSGISSRIPSLTGPGHYAPAHTFGCAPLEYLGWRFSWRGFS